MFNLFTNNYLPYFIKIKYFLEIFYIIMFKTNFKIYLKAHVIIY